MISWTDPPVLAALAVGVLNFGFNLFNLHRASQVRRAAAFRGEFDRIRPSVDAALERLRRVIDELSRLKKSGCADPSTLATIDKLNLETVEAWNGLTQGLRRLDDNELVLWRDWRSGSIDDFDRVSNAFNDARSPTLPSDCQKAVARIETALNALVYKVDQKLAAAVKHYAR